MSRRQSLASSLASICLLNAAAMSHLAQERSGHQRTLDEPSTTTAVAGELQSGVAVISGKPVGYRGPAWHQTTADFPIGVLSGSAKRRDAVRRSWGAVCRPVFIVGMHAATGLWPEAEAASHGDLLLVNQTEIYHAMASILPLKTQMWLVYAHRAFPHAHFVAKVDDDTWVEPRRLLDVLKARRPEYWGYVLKNTRPVRNPKHKWFVAPSVWPGATYLDYCAGAGYVLSQRTLACVASKAAEPLPMPREDVATGILVQRCGATPTHARLFDAFGVRYTRSCSGRSVIKHYVRDMVQEAAARRNCSGGAPSAKRAPAASHGSSAVSARRAPAANHTANRRMRQPSASGRAPAASGRSGSSSSLPVSLDGAAAAASDPQALGVQQQILDELREQRREMREIRAHLGLTSKTLPEWHELCMRRGSSACA